MFKFTEAVAFTLFFLANITLPCFSTASQRLKNLPRTSLKAKQLLPTSSTKRGNYSLCLSNIDQSFTFWISESMVPISTFQFVFLNKIMQINSLLWIIAEETYFQRYVLNCYERIKWQFIIFPTNLKSKIYYFKLMRIGQIGTINVTHSINIFSQILVIGFTYLWLDKKGRSLH